MTLYILYLLSVCTVTALGHLYCYNELGCFDNIYPWFSITRPALSPSPPESVGTTFYFSNSKGENLTEVKTWPTIEMTKKFNADKPTFFITHGFQSDIHANWFSNLTNAILSKTNGNVFAVDWSKGANFNYFRAISNTRIVAAEIARVIQFLASNNSIDSSSIHLMGHSLGSHIMAYVGKSTPGIGRITALDPAGPGYQGRNPTVRLDSNDAGFIDVIHTDGKPLLGLGMSKSVGQVDFFFNGGEMQPSCLFQDVSIDLQTLLNIPKITMDVIMNMVICSHSRAPSYMAAAIEQDCMWGRPYKSDRAHLMYENRVIDKCTNETCTIVGLETPKHPAMGSFVVRTGGSYPYCSSNTTKQSSKGLIGNVIDQVTSIFG